MNRKKQIEEMAKVIEITEQIARDAHCGYPSPRMMATDLYDKGYRKQSEGCDFCNAGSEKCGTCVKFFDYHEDGGSDRCSSEYGNKKCAYYKPVRHCSNCGAKMKGGEG